MQQALSLKRSEVFMVGDNYPTEPVTYQACGACGHTSLAGDKFCRRCGAKQGEQADWQTQGLQSDRLDLIKEADNERKNPASPYTTAPLAQMGAAPSRYRPVSGSLINDLVNGMADAPAAQVCSPLMRRAIFALSMIPIWLIIIFLSPLDAYLAARSVADRNDCGHPTPGQRLGAIFRQA